MTEKTEEAEVATMGGNIAAFKAEQETQNTIARAYPRQPRACLDEALQELEIVPEYACKAFYSIPFKDRSGGEEKIVKVEGPSIKAALALARVWGNNNSGARIKDQDAERIEVEGVYIDHQTNTRTLRTKTVSRFYVDKRTKAKIPLREDKLVLAIAAGGSKAVRDAILAGLPVWLVDSYYNRAREIAAKTIGGKAKAGDKPKTYAEKIGWLTKELGKKGVTGDQIVAYMKGLDGDLSDEDRLKDLIGTYNAIVDGQTTVEDAFGATGAADKPKDKGEISMEDLLGKSKSAQ